MTVHVDRVAASLSQLPTGRDRQSRRRRRQLFRQLDPNGNGVLSLAEVDKGIREGLRIDAPKSVIDRSFHAARDLAPPVAAFSDDFIDENEFRVFLAYLQHYFELWHLFAKMDASNDSRLDYAEFTAALPLLRQWGAKVADPRSEFRRMDHNNGGTVLFDEFAHWALHQGLADLATDPADREDAVQLLKGRRANLAGRDLAHGGAQFDVGVGVQGQGCLPTGAAGSLKGGDRRAAAGRQLLAGALSMAAGGSLEVKIHCARGLRVADVVSSDPYVVLKFGGVDQHTRTIKRDLNPVWNQTFVFAVSEPGPLELAVYDYDVRSADDFLGKVVVDVASPQFATGRAVRWEAALAGPKAKGKLEVSVAWKR